MFTTGSALGGTFFQRPSYIILYVIDHPYLYILMGFLQRQKKLRHVLRNPPLVEGDPMNQLSPKVEPRDGGQQPSTLPRRTRRCKEHGVIVPKSLSDTQVEKIFCVSDFPVLFYIFKAIAKITSTSSYFLIFFSAARFIGSRQKMHGQVLKARNVKR